MKATVVSAATLITTLAAALPANSGPTFESRYTTLGRDDCAVVESGEPEGQDWLLYRCEGQPNLPVWVLYQDSVRMQLAFGPKDFGASAVFSSDRDDAWKVEWRGTGAGAAFKPHAAIARMRPAEGGATVLAVYRIWSDRPACLLGRATDNAAARVLADAGENRDSCG